MKPHRFASLGLVAASLLAGCATSSDKTAEKAKDDADGYVRYVPTGSHISERMKKSKAKLAENQAEHDLDVVRDMQHASHMTLEEAGSGRIKQ